MGGKLDESLEWGAHLVADMPAPVALFDRDQRYVAASPAWSKAFRLGAAPLAGQLHDDFGAAGCAALRKALLRGLSDEATARPLPPERPPDAGGDAVSFDARPYRARDGRLAGVLVALRGNPAPMASDARRLAPDGPAGVADRAALVAQIGTALAAPAAVERGVLVLAISLDNLRGIKNLYSAALAERVWQIIAERLLAGTRTRLAEEDTRGRDLVAVLGPEQFGILCAAPAPAPADAEGLANRLLRLVQAPIAVDGQAVRLSASAGFLTTTPAHRAADDVLRDLDVALQQAQSAGPGKAVGWLPALTAAAARQHSLAEAVRRGYENGEFTLYYQPIVRLRDRRMVGAEALLRWNHPSEGLVPAAAFFPVLEETGLIVEVGCWAIREAIRRLESWRKLYGRDIVEWLSVNLSARQLDNPVSLLATARLIHEASFPIHRLRLEVNEGALSRRPEHCRVLLEEMAALGIHIAIDDFAIGPGALENVQRFPVDTVKIDAAAITRIGGQEGGKVVRALLDFAGAQGTAVIAKSIESEAQYEFLQDSGCGFGQGALFAEPMDAGRFGTFALTNAEAAGRASRRTLPGPPVLVPAIGLIQTSASR